MVTKPLIIFGGLAYRLYEAKVQHGSLTEQRYSLQCAGLVDTSQVTTRGVVSGYNWEMAALVEDEWGDVDMYRISEVEQFQCRRILNMLIKLKELDTISGAFKHYDGDKDDN